MGIAQGYFLVFVIAVIYGCISVILHRLKAYSLKKRLKADRITHLETMAITLNQIRSIIRNYYYLLDRGEINEMALAKTVKEIESTLGMEWVKGQESDRRALEEVWRHF